MKIHIKHVTCVFDWRDTQSFRAWSINTSSSSSSPCYRRNKFDSLDAVCLICGRGTSVLRPKDCPAISFLLTDLQSAVNTSSVLVTAAFGADWVRYCTVCYLRSNIHCHTVLCTTIAGRSMGEKMNEYRVLVVKRGGQRSRRKQGNNFRVYCTEREWLHVEWLLWRKMGTVLNEVVKLEDFVKGINISLLKEERLCFI